MAPEPVHPLYISKNASVSSSPAKKMTTSGLPRPLSEISPGEKRRNSPSWHAYSPKKKALPGNDSSPFQSSPPESSTSPLRFWQNRNSANMPHASRDGSPSPNRRSSIERLQRASRVKNSNILALEQKQEYDPTRIPHIERPLAKVQGSTLTSSSSFNGVRSSDSSRPHSDDATSSPSIMSPPSNISPPQLSQLSQKTSKPLTKDQASPTKSSLSPSKLNRNTFSPAAGGTWSGDSSLSETDLSQTHFLRRRPKSVTFDAAPPQVNEYEMGTPDLSSIETNSREGSYESVEEADDDDDDDDSDLYDSAHVGIQDESFDESLEDTDKTPVVGPDDWRRDSLNAPQGVAGQRHEGSPLPDIAPAVAAGGRTTPTNKRTDSANSNGDQRPLPPLPELAHARSTTSSPGLAATAERMSGGLHRSLPAPPPASASKSDIQNFGNNKMSLGDRLKLMMLSDDNDAKAAADQQRERRLRRGNGRERGGTPHSEVDSEATTEIVEAEDTIGDISGLNLQSPPKISRESIMRRVNGNDALLGPQEFNDSSPIASPHRHHSRNMEDSMVDLDPDVPIPSVEDSLLGDEFAEEDSVIITRNFEDNEEDAESYCPDDDLLPNNEGQDQDNRDTGHQRDHHDQPAALDALDAADHEIEHSAAGNRLSSLYQHPKVDVVITGFEIGETDDPFNSPPLVTVAASDLVEGSSQQPKTPQEEAGESFEPVKRPVTPTRRLSKPEYDGTGWGEPDEEEQYADGATSPDSVIHHSPPEQEARLSPPAVPERIATIKAPGAKLKTRPSNTPSDLAAMREARRQVSHEIPDVPPIPQRHQNRMSRDLGAEQAPPQDDYVSRHPSFKDRSLTLDLDMGLSLDRDFERVIETQKRGYLMRQNTKVITASDKDGEDHLRARSTHNSPVKQNRPESWVVEPWKTESRQRSTRKRVAGTDNAVPPLPGHGSNAAAVDRASLEDAQSEAVSTDSGERGRLFVKVMGVKDLDLPLPKNERTWFSLTLDNGVHCVTTAWLELARNAPIGQEFELVVPNDLEFQLTLNVKLEKPATLSSQAPSKPLKSKTSTLSRVFASPKKRREMEQRQREEERQQKEALARQRNSAPSGYELLSPLAAEDGSFARAYVCLKDHENHCFGRPYMAEIACFNEWATEEESFASSVKSKRGNPATAVVRRAPYKIGKLELQLLFVPRPKNVTDDDMPKSMNSCVRELKAAEERLARSWEGHLSQQGGDCPYWRRRYFKLAGTKLTAYHEATRQPRATINLSNAKRLIDDRRKLMEKETTGKGGARRRSGFAEEEEGYMFVEEGFRIRFNNGEVIDFYADTAEDKEGWMKALSEVTGRDSSFDDAGNVRSRAKWCEVVLKREEHLRRKAESRHGLSRTRSAGS